MCRENGAAANKYSVGMDLCALHLLMAHVLKLCAWAKHSAGFDVAVIIVEPPHCFYNIRQTSFKFLQINEYLA